VADNKRMCRAMRGNRVGEKKKRAEGRRAGPRTLIRGITSLGWIKSVVRGTGGFPIFCGVFLPIVPLIDHAFITTLSYFLNTSSAHAHTFSLRFPPKKPARKRCHNSPPNHQLDTRRTSRPLTIRIRRVIPPVLVDTVPAIIALVVDVLHVHGLTAFRGGAALLADVRRLRLRVRRGRADERVAGEGAAEAAGGLVRELRVGGWWCRCGGWGGG